MGQLLAKWDRKRWRVWRCGRSGSFVPIHPMLEVGDHRVHPIHRHGQMTVIYGVAVAFPLGHGHVSGPFSQSLDGHVSLVDSVDPVAGDWRFALQCDDDASFSYGFASFSCEFASFHRSLNICNGIRAMWTPFGASNCSDSDSSQCPPRWTEMDPHPVIRVHVR